MSVAANVMIGSTRVDCAETRVIPSRADGEGTPNLSQAYPDRPLRENRECDETER
jgi:hypothetical protein